MVHSGTIFNTMNLNFICHSRYYCISFLLGLVLLTGCQAEQAAFHFQPPAGANSRTKASRNSLTWSSNQPDSAIKELANLPVTSPLPSGTHSRPQAKSVVALPRTIFTVRLENTSGVKDASRSTTIKRAKHKNPADSLHNLPYFIAIIALLVILVVVLVIVAL
jgi:hypothetical protein